MRTSCFELTLVGVFFISLSATAQTSAPTAASKTTVFPKGEKAPAGNFTGTVWVQPLVDNDSVYNLISGSVTFESGARTNWHIHPTGQILMITEGTGYHQIKGQPRELIRRGEVVKCPPNVAHWHGASPGSSMTHIYMIPNTEKGIVQWLQPVSEEEYNRSK
ncbi:(R)-mandelonitrile lyase [Spirosoma linguale]|uniref:Cupin 2 conserved barrel domain protein n=1 Tax=Spirosoma linguale (strain ATCC 33905 / DSM 74 / LMG 10896 / Claus 1) TaxID=504472 RepID=D2QCI8_SPILD|nr:Cupin 2 conserved barrel domain protein [Spirosoma linguale DSM 74]